LILNFTIGPRVDKRMRMDTEHAHMTAQFATLVDMTDSVT